MSDDYSVGYKKPPSSGQFRPGQSGNSKGRPKNSQNLGYSIKKAFGQKVELTQGGKKKRVSVKDAFALRLVHSAIHGNVSEQIRVMQAIDKYAPSLLEVEAQGPEQINIKLIDPDGVDRDLKLSERERKLVRRTIEALRAGDIDRKELIALIENDPLR